MSKNQTADSWQRRRREVLERDQHECQSCGCDVTRGSENTANVHHKTPVSEGGSDDPENLVTLCTICHSQEHDENGVGGFIPLDEDPLMAEIVEYFLEEPGLTSGALVDWTDKSRATVTGRLNQLRAADCIEYVHEPTGLHRLTNDPREDNDDWHHSRPRRGRQPH